MAVFTLSTLVDDCAFCSECIEKAKKQICILSTTGRKGIYISKMFNKTLNMFMLFILINFRKVTIEKVLEDFLPLYLIERIEFLFSFAMKFW